LTLSLSSLANLPAGKAEHGAYWQKVHLLATPTFVASGGKISLHVLAQLGCLKSEQTFKVIYCLLQSQVFWDQVTQQSIHSRHCRMPEDGTSHLLDLPSTCLALLIQHTASGPGGLASAAALTQTCKFLHSLSEGPAVTYSNIHVPGTTCSPAYQVWQWLAKRSGRVAGLTLELLLVMAEDEASEWMQPLQILSGIPSVELRRVFWGGTIADRNHPCITQWLRQHGQNTQYLALEARISEDMLELRELAEAAAVCKSIDLSIVHEPNQVIDLAELAPLSGSLRCFTCECDTDDGILSGVHAFSSLQQLTALKLRDGSSTTEEPWEHLAKLTNLVQLAIAVSASGDPSPLSALTNLSSLSLTSKDTVHADPFSFSSLQPLSTLQKLEALQLTWHACTAPSLQGLAGLSKLKKLDLYVSSGLESLEGIGPGVAVLSIQGASDLVSLAGIERCSSLKHLSLTDCGVSSLQPLRGLSSLEGLGGDDHSSPTSLEGLCGTSLQSLSLSHCRSLTSLSGVEQHEALTSLMVESCGVTSLQPLSQIGEGLQALLVRNCREVQEVVLELPNVWTTAHVDVYKSGVREVVLAGGVSRTVV
jgi:Leucine-rich repeat (LRR) protein